MGKTKADVINQLNQFLDRRTPKTTAFIGDATVGYSHVSWQHNGQKFDMPIGNSINVISQTNS